MADLSAGCAVLSYNHHYGRVHVCRLTIVFTSIVNIRASVRSMLNVDSVRCVIFSDIRLIVDCRNSCRNVPMNTLQNRCATITTSVSTEENASKISRINHSLAPVHPVPRENSANTVSCHFASLLY